ncbi:MAG: ATP-binding cassette domain-containing protein, partial [Pseudomonadota bacterium]
MTESDHLLEVEDLGVEFRTAARRVHAVNGVSFHVDAGETLAILGESGSGKSVTFEAILGILESPPGFVTGGKARYRGRDLLTLAPRERRVLCGKKLGMIFQDPLSVLNPVFTGARDADPIEQFDGSRFSLAAGQPLMHTKHFAELPADGEHGVEHGKRILKDHA